MKHLTHIAAMLASLAPNLVGAGEAGALDPGQNRVAFHAAGPLDAGQLQAIQHAGRSVLTAKRGYGPSAEQVALREELKALSAAIDAALAPRPGANVLLRDSADASAATPSAAPGDRVGELRARLATVRERRQKIEGDTRRAPSHPSQPRMRQLTAKVADLEREADAALNASGGDRIDRLRRLRERLQAKDWPETMDERSGKPAGRSGDAAPREVAGAPSESTPTISTLVRHR